MKKCFLLLTSLFNSAVMTTELPQFELQQIEAKIKIMAQGLQQQNWYITYRMMPPKLIEIIAQENGQTSESWIENNAYRMQMEANVSVFQGMHYDLTKMIVRQSPIGRSYVFVPNQMYWKNRNDGEVEIEEGYKLAFKDGYEWYFLDYWDSEGWEEYGKPLMLKIYPDLADLDFPQ